VKEIEYISSCLGETMSIKKSKKHIQKKKLREKEVKKRIHENRVQLRI